MLLCTFSGFSNISETTHAVILKNWEKAKKAKQKILNSFIVDFFYSNTWANEKIIINYKKTKQKKKTEMQFVIYIWAGNNAYTAIIM